MDVCVCGEKWRARERAEVRDKKVEIKERKAFKKSWEEKYKVRARRRERGICCLTLILPDKK